MNRIIGAAFVSFVGCAIMSQFGMDFAERQPVAMVLAALGWHVIGRWEMRTQNNVALVEMNREAQAMVVRIRRGTLEDK